jgi:hypothetical protein
MIFKFEDFLTEHKLHKTLDQFLSYLNELSKSKVFVFLDTETTGLGGHKKQQLTQISAIAYNYNFQSNTFNDAFGTFNKKIKISQDMRGRLTDPKDDIRKKFKFNHYGDKITDDPTYYDEQDILSEFRDWVAHAGYYLEPLLVIQNAIFDMNMLVGRGGKKLPYEVLDTKQLIQLFVIPITQKLAETDPIYQEKLEKIGLSERDAGLTSSSMSKWGPFFGVNMSGYHDALTDCQIASDMFIKIVDYIKDNKSLNISKYQAERIRVK